MEQCNNQFTILCKTPIESRLDPTGIPNEKMTKHVDQKNAMKSLYQFQGTWRGRNKKPTKPDFQFYQHKKTIRSEFQNPTISIIIQHTAQTHTQKRRKQKKYKTKHKM